MRLSRRRWVMAAALAAALGGIPVPPADAGEKQDGPPVLDEVLSIGTPDDDALVQWTAVAVDGSGNIYVLDGLDYSIKKFDHQGQLVKKAGRKGQGPGEFNAPRHLAFDGAFLYAADHGVLGLQVFDTDLRYLRTIPWNRPVMLLKAAAPGRLIVGGMNFPGSPAKWTEIDAQGRRLSETTYLQKVDLYLSDSLSMAIDRAGQIYVAFSHRDRIEKRDPGGQILWTRSLEGAGEPEVETIAGLRLAKTIFSYDLAVDNEGRVLVLAGGRAKHPARDVRVFDAKGEALPGFTLPEPSHCLYVDSKGFLYVRANAGVTLKKYRLAFR